MEPTIISARNFGAHKETLVDLSPIRLASISGVNGSGKSTLFTDTLLYAFYGVTTKGTPDEIMRTGEEDMAVEVHFLLEGSEYNVSRWRSRKGKGKTTLEFQVREGDGWKSLTGNSIDDTEARIRKLLRVSKDTFISSCLILQGRANEFTAKGPTDRKKVLSEILGLEVYDRLQEAAKKRAGEIGQQALLLKARQEQIAGETAKEESLRAEAEKCRAEVAAIKADLAGHRKQLDEDVALLAQLNAKIGSFASLETERGKVDGEVKDLLKEQVDLEVRMLQARKLVNCEAQILQKAGEYDRARERIAALEAVVPRLTVLDEEIRRIGKTRENLGRQAHDLREKCSVILRELSQKDDLEKAAAEYKAASEELDELIALSEKDAALTHEILPLENDHDRKWEQRKALQDTVVMLKRKTAMLTDSGCLDPEKAACRFLSDAQAAKALIPETEAKAQDLTTEIDTLQTRVKEMEEKRKAVAYAGKMERHYQLTQTVPVLRKKAEAYAQLAAKEETLAALNGQSDQIGRQAVETAERQTQADREAEDLRKQTAELPALKFSLPNLEQWAKGKEQLPAAKQTLSEGESRVKSLGDQIRNRHERVAEIDAALKPKAEILAEKTGAEKHIEFLKGDIEILTNQADERARLLGMVQKELQTVEAMKAEGRELAVKLASAAEDQTRYQTLEKAFSKNGIQALIIEASAVPQLEEIANDILQRLTSGGMRVRFDTQKDLKSMKGVQAETLEIIVGDWRGERPYETFSGGEKFRLDFAIRIALSKLLAHRAGASLRFLVCDEGVGTLDAEGRQALVECFEAIKDDFAKVLLITHVESLQDVFPQRIYVQKDDEGSKVTVVA